MKPFFTDNDFEGDIEITLGHTMGPMIGCKKTVEKVSKAITIDKAVELANAKLEREGTLIYGQELLNCGWGSSKSPVDKYKALLINVEPIGACKHPVEKVSSRMFMEIHGSGAVTSGSHKYGYFCECGQRMKQVISYEEEK